MILIYIFLIALSLSMDSFSLAIALYTSINDHYFFLYSFLVGLFHFVMPIIGFILGLYIKLTLNDDLLTFLIFTIIWVKMLKDYIQNKKQSFSFNLFSAFIIALSVSLDSLGVGFTISDNILLSSTIFSLIAFTNTYLGLILGKYINQKLGSKSLMLGITILFGLSLIHFINFLNSI